MKFTNEELKSLLIAQDELNEKYSGKNWREDIPLQSFVNASLGEIAEWLDSSPRVENNRWWRKDLQNDTQNQIIEIIDVLHFNLSVLLHEYDIDSILEFNNDIPEKFDFDEDLGKYTIKHIHYGIMAFIDASYISDDYESDNPRIKRLYALLISNYLLLQTMCIATSTDDEKVDLKRIYNGYFKKNELNKERIDGGYQEGKYEKVNEDGEEDNVKLDV